MMATPVIESHPGFIEEIDASEMELKDPVGKGSFGVVYMAVWRSTHVAVKMIESESERIAFMTELRQLSRVCHPNIIRLYGACRNPVSLVMEFAECGSLYNLLHGPGLQPHYTSGHAMSWCLQCATGVAYLHGMKPKALIHRDLKPPNLLLTNNGIVLKICDFGTACDQHTYMTNNKGSAAWMAPEVFEGCQYSEKCDVFSWGIILWEVLTRRKPFDDLGGPAFRIMWAVHTGTRPNLIQGCPKPIEQLMTSCWSAEPGERPSMDEVVTAMTDLLHFFPGGNETLVFPLHDGDSSSVPSSSTGSSYDLTGTDRGELTHGATISDTVRKQHHAHSNLTHLTRTRPPGSPVLGTSPRHQEIAGLSEGRARSRSHTPDPHKPPALPEPPSSPLVDAGKTGSRRRSSADLIAEIEQQPIESPRTPIGSRSASPAPNTRLVQNQLYRAAISSPPSAPASSPATVHPLAPPTTVVVTSPQGQQPTTSNMFLSPTTSKHVMTSPSSSSQQHGDSLETCESLPRAHITLELHLQPLPPSTSSHESMDIYQQHCLLAEEYLRVQTEINLWEQRAEQLRVELAHEERNEEEGNRLNNEFHKLSLENKALRKWRDKMKSDLTRVRHNQQRGVWTASQGGDDEPSGHHAAAGQRF